MDHREHVIKAVEEAIPFVDSRGYGGVAELLHDVLELLKEQEPRLINTHDFENADNWGNIPAWCEYNPLLGVKTIDAWKIITIYNLRDKDARYWTQRPTKEQSKAVKWDE